MVIAMAIAYVTTSIAVSIATTKILAAYYFKIVDSYVDEMCKETRRFINEACEEINVLQNTGSAIINNQEFARAVRGVCNEEKEKEGEPDEL